MPAGAARRPRGACLRGNWLLDLAKPWIVPGYAAAPASLSAQYLDRFCVGAFGLRGKVTPSAARSPAIGLRLRPPINDGRARTQVGGCEELVGDDRLPGGEVGLLLRPGAARRAAAQRIDGHLQLVTGLEGLARPAFAHQRARARAFEVPGRGAAVSALHL